MIENERNWRAKKNKANKHEMQSVCRLSPHNFASFDKMSIEGAVKKKRNKVIEVVA